MIQALLFARGTTDDGIDYTMGTPITKIVENLELAMGVN